MNHLRDLAMDLYKYNKRLFGEAEEHFHMEDAKFQSPEYWDARKYYWMARKTQRQEVWQDLRILARNLNKRV
jgi:hypothetical protein